MDHSSSYDYHVSGNLLRRTTGPNFRTQERRNRKGSVHRKRRKRPQQSWESRTWRIGGQIRYRIRHRNRKRRRIARFLGVPDARSGIFRSAIRPWCENIRRIAGCEAYRHAFKTPRRMGRRFRGVSGLQSHRISGFRLRPEFSHILNGRREDSGGNKGSVSRRRGAYHRTRLFRHFPSPDRRILGFAEEHDGRDPRKKDHDRG